MPLFGGGIIIIRAQQFFAGAVAPYGMLECAGGKVRHAHGKPHEQDKHQHSPHRLKGTAPAMHGIGHHAKQHTCPDQPDLREQRNNEIKHIVMEGDIDEIENSFIDDLKHRRL